MNYDEESLGRVSAGKKAFIAGAIDKYAELVSAASPKGEDEKEESRVCLWRFP